MTYVWPTYRLFSNAFQKNERLYEKFMSLSIIRNQNCERTMKNNAAIKVIMQRRLYSGAICTHLTRNLEIKAALKLAKLESGITRISWNVQQSCCLCQDSSKQRIYQHSTKQEQILKDVFRKKKEQFLEREQKIRQTGQNILQDIRETKEKMKERMEGVIERENIWTIPNILCVGRIIASPYLGYLILNGNFALALGIFGIAGVTDMLDGWIARNFDQASKLGSFLDPMADKILVGVLFTTLTIAGHISVGLTALIIARDLLLVGAGFYIRYKSLPAPRTLSRYFDASLVTAQLQPTFISKVNTVIQLLLVAAVMSAPVWNMPSPEALLTLSYITAGTTIASAVSYAWQRDTYHIFNKKK